jgi:hypothetical protein
MLGEKVSSNLSPKCKFNIRVILSYFINIVDMISQLVDTSKVRENDDHYKQRRKPEARK